MSSDLWANVASGAVGGVAALAGHWVVNYLQTKAEDRRRKAEAEAKELAELKTAYVAYMHELGIKARHIVDFCQKDVNATDAQIKEFISKHLLLDGSDVYFRLRMLETDADGAEWVRKIGNADETILRLCFPGEQPTAMDLFQAAKPAFLLLYAFQEWLYTKRFKRGEPNALG